VLVYCIHGIKVEERARCTICNSFFKAGGRALNLTRIAVAIKCLQIVHACSGELRYHDSLLVDVFQMKIFAVGGSPPQK
jgi:hypothetical protein